MSTSVKKVLVQVTIAALFMVAVAGISLVTATAGVSPNKFPPAYAATKTAVEGRKVFQTSGCASCHQIMRQGGNGPDLTYIGRKYNRREIAEVVRHPRKYLKSGAGDLMPAFSKKELPDGRLDVLSRYLSTLK